MQVSVGLAFCMRPNLHFEISNLTAANTVEIVEIPGEFLGGFSEDFSGLFCFPFWSAAFRCTRAGVGWRPRREVRHVRLWACIVGDEILIYPGDLSRSLVLGFLVFHCLFEDW